MATFCIAWNYSTFEYWLCCCCRGRSCRRSSRRWNGCYIKGELKATEAYNVPTVWKATEKAVDELQLVVTDKYSDATAGKLEAMTADTKKVRISLKRQGDNITEITIRVGTFGDEELSRFILSKIQKHLKG